MSHDEALVEKVTEALNDEGAAPGGSIHSWRCEYPDHYGPCTCVDETARAVLDALDVPGLIRAAKAEALREIVADLRIAWGDGPPGTRYYGALQWFDPPARNMPLKDWLLARAAEIDPEEGDHE